MAWIEWIDEDAAEGDLAEVFSRFKRSADGTVDHILKIHSLNPESLDHHYNLYAHLMRCKSQLSRADREMIAVAVSRSNDCFY